MRNRNIHTAAFALAGLMTLTPAFAWQNQGATTTPQPREDRSRQEQGSGNQGQGQGQGQGGTASMNAQDRRFVTEATTANLAEIELGRLASERASNADVKAYGRRMVEDHTTASQRMTQTVRDGGVTMTLPTELTAEQRQHRDRLSRATGAEFDRMYMSHMVKDHQKTITNFEQQAERGENQALRSFAQQTLPTLREHLRLAQEIATKVGADQGNHSGHSGH